MHSLNIFLEPHLMMDLMIGHTEKIPKKHSKIKRVKMHILTVLVKKPRAGENRSSKAKDLSVFSPRMVALCHHHLQVLNKESFTIVGWRDTESKCFKSCIRVGSSVTRVIWLPVGAGLLFSSFLWAPLLSSPSLFLKLCANYSADDIIIIQNGEVPTQPLGTQQTCSSS